MSARRTGIAGFTLVEALLATALMGVILAAIGTVTAQWLPNWNRGIARVQRAERLAIGLERIAADLSVAEMMPLNAEAKLPLFDGGEMRRDFTYVDDIVRGVVACLDGPPRDDGEVKAGVDRARYHIAWRERTARMIPRHEIIAATVPQNPALTTDRF